MTLLLLILLTSILVFLFYYEFLWKKMEQKRGKGLLSMARDFMFKENEVATGAVSSNWSDWRYRLIVELHRRGQLDAKQGSEIVGISQEMVEEYLDNLESDGKIQQAGDAERGIYYKPAT